MHTSERVLSAYIHILLSRLKGFKTVKIIYTAKRRKP